MSACAVNEDSPKLTSDLRMDFIEGKTDLEIKQEFFNLKFEDEKGLWISKLKKVLTTEINQDQKIHIISLVLELEKITDLKELKSSTVQGLEIEIVKITPKEDLLSMFTNLRNFETSSQRNSTICDECIGSLINDWENKKDIYDVNARTLASCNCKWTCGVCFCSFDVKMTSYCTATSSGCGFRWLQSCEKRDYI
jgi:hypothetical protein